MWGWIAFGLLAAVFVACAIYFVINMWHLIL